MGGVRTGRAHRDSDAVFTGRYGDRSSVNVGRSAPGSGYSAAMLGAHERFVDSGPLRIWTDRVGDPGLPAVLMVMGSSAQGVSCPDALVARLVERGVQVIRFDHRDTGRSSVVDFDTHPYTIGDMARDCLAVLDGYGLRSAHVAGTSLGGMIAQWLGVHAPDRVRSLTLMSSSPMGHDPGPVWARARSRRAGRSG